jgi:CRISPR-associated helicase Cas3
MLSALYLPYKENKRHAFELSLINFVERASKGEVLILHAPTGAGKTHAVLGLTRRVEGVLLCVPTNALAAEIEEAYSREFPGSVARWNAEAFLERDTKSGISRHETMIEDARGKSLIVSNPDILHLFTQHEYVPKDSGFRSRLRLSSFGMKNLDLLVFDEYHAYDERVLASVLVYILKSRRTKDNRQKFVFMSATPDEGLPIALKKLGIPFIEPATDEPTTEELDPDRGRLIKGPIEVEVCSKPITASLSSSPPGRRTLFIFSTFLDQQAAVRSLRRQGLQEADCERGFVQITGRKTHSEKGQDTWELASILLATSKVEVGLNISGLDRVVMEPGWTEQQFWQRFGRAARGKPAQVTLHFPGYPECVLTPLRSARTYMEMAHAVQSLLRTERQHVDTILRFVGAYAASYHENTPPSADWKVLEMESLPAAVQTGYGLVQKMFRSWDKDETKDEPGGSGDWMRTIRLSLRGLRGRTLRARTIYEWAPDDPVEESIQYVLTRTDWRREDDTYWVREFLERPKDASLHYNLLDGAEATVAVRGGRLQRDEFLHLPSKMRSVIRQEFGDPLPPFWEALIGWLELVPPDEIPPREVTPDDIFL